MATDNYIPKVGDENRIDNKLRTMRGAVGGLMAQNGKIRIASGYFRLSGVTELEDDFRDFFTRSENNSIKLLLSNQYDTKNPETRTVFQIAEGTLADYSSESFYLDNQFYQELVGWIKAGRLAVKIFVDSKFYETHERADIAFLHGKAYMFSESENSMNGSVLIGSSNFTYGGLVANRELNIFSSDSFPPLKNWFDEMWSEYSEDYSDELISGLEKQKVNAKPKIVYTPVDYFYWNLGKYFGRKASKNLISRIKEIEKNLPYPSRGKGEKYFAHQFYGIQHVYESLKEFDTQILADGVGLGKTLEAASIIKLYLQDLSLDNDKRRILILANDRLREQWQEELRNVEVDTSRVDITTRQKFTGLDKENLQKYAEIYAFVIIDEAHEGFLRQNNRAYQNMKTMINYARETQVRTLRGLLLTATPWNNSREDVIRLGLLFLNIQKVPKQRQYYNYVITNREKLLYDTKDNGKYNQSAYIEFWKDLYYQRTRTSLASDEYLSDRYPVREFPLEEGDKPFMISYSPEVSVALSDILGRLIELNLPYQDTIWQYFGPDKISNVIQRQRFQLLRRADSSNAAFGKSLQNIKEKLENFQTAISKLTEESLSQVKKYFYAKVDEDYAKTVNENEDAFDLLEEAPDLEGLNKSKQDRIQLINENLTERSLSRILEQMLKDAESDIHNLDEILISWEIVSKQDEKQKTVISQIREIVSRGEKVLIFSEFSDTVEDYFRKMLEDEVILSAGIGMVHGGSDRINYDESTKKEVLGRFSPISKSYELFGKKQIAVLIGTDAISTGQNLQDASYVMTIELPYNPMRLEQRIGRIDRPKAKGENRIFVYAFPSEEIISAELKLSERFEGKAKGAATDTEGDFLLPFVHDGKFEGLIKGLSDNEKHANNTQEELIASVSDFEARERVRDFYENIGEDFVKGKEYKDFPYSFTHEAEKLLLVQGELKDINGSAVERTEPELWNISSASQADFVKVEGQVKALLGKNLAPKTDEADDLIKSCEVEQRDIVRFLVEQYNSSLKSESELEQQPAYISELRSLLMSNASRYRTSFEEQKVEGKEFINIVKSLTSRGFTPEQNLFLRNLQGENKQLSSVKITQNIWKNLKRFVEVFALSELQEQSQEVLVTSRTKANSETSKIKVIAGIL